MILRKNEAARVIVSEDSSLTTITSPGVGAFIEPDPHGVSPLFLMFKDRLIKIDLTVDATVRSFDAFGNEIDPPEQPDDKG